MLSHCRHAAVSEGPAVWRSRFGCYIIISCSGSPLPHLQLVTCTSNKPPFLGHPPPIDLIMSSPSSNSQMVNTWPTPHQQDHVCYSMHYRVPPEDPKHALLIPKLCSSDPVHFRQFHFN